MWVPHDHRALRGEVIVGFLTLGNFGASASYFRLTQGLTSRQNGCMSTVEDIRKVLQDFLAPELRTITARLEGIDQRFDGLRSEMSARFETMDTKLVTLGVQIQDIKSALELDRRLTKLESRQRATQ